MDAKSKISKFQSIRNSTIINIQTVRNMSLFFAEFIISMFGLLSSGPNHPMKPHRLTLTHNLVFNYELHRKMEVNILFFPN